MSRLLWIVRYAVPAAIVLAGFVLVAVDPHEHGIEGAAMLVGAGLSVALLNFLFRVGVQGDRDREAEEEARSYFDRHGRWPDERPRR